MRKFRVVLAVLVVMLLSMSVVACGGTKITSVELNSTAETIVIGGSFQLTATVLPDKAKDEDKVVTWSSSDDAIATVTDDGLVKGVAKGQATITAAAGGKSATATITVEEVLIDDFTLNVTGKQTLYTTGGADNGYNSLTLSVKDINPANPTLKAFDFAIVNADGQAAESTAIEMTGTGADRVIKAKATGTAFVKVSSADDGDASQTIEIEVKAYDAKFGIAVSTAAEFQRIKDGLSLKFYLANDIDFEGAQIAPIGDQELWNHEKQNSENGDTARDVPNGFRGTFDGRGHTLKDFTIVAGPPNTENTCYNNALFPGLYGGTIKNLAIVGVKQDTGVATDLSRPALLVNSLYAGTLENIYIEGEILAPGRSDNWRRGGTIFGGTGDISDPVGEKYVTIRNIITNVTVKGDTNKNMVYPVAGRIEGASTNANTVIENIFVVSDSLTQTALAGSNEARVTKSQVFKIADVGKADFAALSDVVWDTTDNTKLPVLKVFGAPREDITVAGTGITGAGFTLNAEGVAVRFEPYAFSVTVQGGYRTETKGDNTFAVKVKVDDTEKWIEPTTDSKGAGEYTFNIGVISNVETSIEIKEVRGVVKFFEMTLTADRGIKFEGESSIDAGEDYTFSFTLSKGFKFDAGEAAEAIGTEGEDDYVPAVEAWDNFRFGYKIGDKTTWIQEGVTTDFCKTLHKHITEDDVDCEEADCEDEDHIHESDVCAEDCDILHAQHDDTCAVTSIYGFTIPKAEITANFEIIIEGILLDGTRYEVDLSVSSNVGVGISTVAEFLTINDDLAGNYYLMNDIDFSGVQGVQPIAFRDAVNDSERFTGTFDGNGFAIKNLTLNSGGTGSPNGAYPGPTQWGIALFNEVGKTGVIKNLSLINITTKGDACIGTIAGTLRGTIENCYIEGKVTATNGWGSYPNGGGSIAGTITNSAVVKNVVTKVEGSDGVFPVAATVEKSTSVKPTFQNVFVVGDKIKPGAKYTTEYDWQGGVEAELYADNCFVFGVTDATAPLKIEDVDFSVLPDELWDGNVEDGATALPTLIEMSVDAPYGFVWSLTGKTVDPEATGDVASTQTFPMQDYLITMKLRDGYVVPSGKKITLTLSMDQGAADPIEMSFVGSRNYTIDDGEFWTFLIDVDEEMVDPIAGNPDVDFITGNLSIPAPRAATEKVPAIPDDPTTEDIDESKAEVPAKPAFTAITNVVKVHTVTGLGGGEGFTVESDNDELLDNENYYFTVTLDEAGKIPTVTYVMGGAQEAAYAEFESSSEDGLVFTYSISKVKGNLALTVDFADQSAFEAVEGGEDAGAFNIVRNAMFTVKADDVATVDLAEGNVTYVAELLSGNVSVLSSATDGIKVSGSGIIEFRFWFLVDGAPTFYVDVTIEALNLSGVNADWTPISTPEEFNAMRNNEKGNYYLTNDIVFTGTDAERTIVSLFPSSKDNNTPTIGFKGTFDGRGYTIKDVRVRNRRESTDKDHNVSLFGQIAPAGVVKNVSVIGFDIDTWNRGGALATYIYGTVENVYLEGKFVSRYNNTTTIGNDNWDRSSTIAAGVRAGGILRNVVAKVDTKSSPNDSGIFAVTSVQKPQTAPNSTVAASIANVFVVSDNLKTWKFSGSTAATLVKTGDYAWGIDENADGVRTLQDANVFKAADIATIDFSALSSDFWAGNVADGATALPSLKNLAAPAADANTYYDSIAIMDAATAGNEVTVLDLDMEEEVDLFAIGAFSGGGEPGEKTIRWFSSDTSVATVSAAGKVKGLFKNGTAIIYAYNEVTFAKVAVTVTGEEPPAEIAGFTPIGTVAEFKAINANADARSGKYYLTNDIDFDGETVNSIGGGSDAFTGTLDGRGYALKNITITKGTSANQTSLFARSGSGTVIRNLAITDLTTSSATGSQRAGLVVAEQRGGTYENLYLQGTVNSNASSSDTGNMPGGIFGSTSGGPTDSGNGTLIVRNVVVVPTSANNQVRGIGRIGAGFGSSNTTIVQNVFVVNDGLQEARKNDPILEGSGITKSNIQAFASSALATQNFSALPRDFWKGNVTSGATELPTLELKEPATMFDITLPKHVAYKVTGAEQVELDTDYAFKATVTKHYGEVTGDVVVANYTLGEEDLTVEGVLDETNEDAVVYNFKIEDVTDDITVTSIEGITKIEGEAVAIGTAEEFSAALNPDTKVGNFYLTNDIDFEDAEIPTIGKNDPANCFVGTFDGRGFALKNFKTNSTSDYDASLFAGLGDTGVIKNVSIINAQIKYTAKRSGILVGTIRGGTIENVYCEGTIGTTGGGTSNSDRSAWVVGATTGSMADQNTGRIIMRNIVVKPTALRGTEKGGEAALCIVLTAPNQTTADSWTNNQPKNLLVENFFAVTDIAPNTTPFVGYNSGTPSTFKAFKMAEIDTVDFSALLANWNLDTESGLPELREAPVDVVTVKVLIDDGSEALTRYTTFRYTLIAGESLDLEEITEALEAYLAATKLRGYDNTLESALGAHGYALEVEVITEAEEEGEEDSVTYEAFEADMLDEIESNLTIIVRLGIFA